MGKYEDDFLEHYSVVPPKFRRDGVRRGREDDASAIVAVQYRPHFGPPPPDERQWRTWLRDGTVWVAEEDSEIVGLLRADTLGNEGEITNMEVADEHRGRGVEALLIRKALKQLREIGCKSVVTWGEPYDLNVRISNPTDRFWNRLGFVRDEVASEGGPNGLYIYRHTFAEQARGERRGSDIPRHHPPRRARP